MTEKFNINMKQEHEVAKKISKLYLILYSITYLKLKINKS